MKNGTWIEIFGLPCPSATIGGKPSEKPSGKSSEISSGKLSEKSSVIQSGRWTGPLC